jgi:primosomal protein N' (replication factor Y)
MPPFGRLAALILSSPDPQRLEDAARALARAAPNLEGVQVLGPAPAPLALLRGRHRRRFLLKARRDVAVQKVVRAWVSQVKLPGNVRLQIDIDPYSFL